MIGRPRDDYAFRALLHPRSRLADEKDPVTDPLPIWASECEPDWDEADPATYRMLCVDGGAMDNEPLELVRRGLAGWNGRNPRAGNEADRAVLLVDPFANKETPGLGDKIVKDTMFVHEFAGAASPLAGVKRGKGKTPNDVEMITGATISSRAVIHIINNAIARWQPLMDKYTEVP